MAELIVSYHVYGGMGNPVGQRIWDDGRVESFLVSKLEKNESGRYEYKAVVPGWYPTTQIGDEQMTDLEEALREANVSAIPENIDQVDRNRTDTTTAIWQVRTETDSSVQLKEIQVAQWGPLAPEAEPLMALLLKMHEIINSMLVAQS